MEKALAPESESWTSEMGQSGLGAGEQVMKAFELPCLLSLDTRSVREFRAQRDLQKQETSLNSGSTG